MVTRVACCSRATALAVAQSAARVRAAEAASSAPVSGASEAAAGQLSSRLGDSCVAAATAESRTLHTPAGSPGHRSLGPGPGRGVSPATTIRWSLVQALAAGWVTEICTTLDTLTAAAV